LDVVTQLKNTETAASRSGSPELNPPGAAARLLIRMPSYNYSSALDAVQQQQQHGRKIRRATHLIDRREREAAGTMQQYYIHPTPSQVDWK